MNKFETGFSEWVLRHRLILILLCLGLVILTFTHGREFNPTTDYRVFFSKENPQLLAFEELENTFSKNDNILFVLSPKNGNIYTRETLAAIDFLSNEERVKIKVPCKDNPAKRCSKWTTRGKAWLIPHSTRVDSITNFRYTKAEKHPQTGEDMLSTYALAPNPQKLTDAQLKEIRRIIESEPSLIGRIASKQGHVAGVNVTIELPRNKAKTAAVEAVSYARRLAAQLEKKFPHIKVRLVGMVMFNNAFTEASMNDVRTLYPIALGLIVLFLIVLLRSVTASVLTIVVMLMSIMAGMNMALMVNFPITPPLMTAPVVILTVAVANSVHILVSFIAQMRLGSDRIAAIKESLRINITPVFLTSFTTAIGFLTMNFSEVPPFRHLGNVVAMGVTISFILSVTFLPALLSFLPVRIRKRTDTDHGPIDRFADFVVRRRTPIMWSMLAVIITLISFVPKNELNDIFLEYFDKRIQIRNDMDYTTKNLTGLYQIEYSVDSGRPGGLKNPEYLREVERFVDWLRRQKEVLHVFTFLDTLKRINKSMHNDDPKWYRLPDTGGMAAEYMFMYENSVPAGFDPKNQVDIAYQTTRVTLNTVTMSTKQMLRFEQRVQDWLKKNKKLIVKAEGTGPTMMFSHTSRRNIVSMLKGTTIALIIISLILVLAFRSLKIGLLSMVPNLVPAAMGFGIWGIFSGQVGLALSVVSGMTLGIVVDDTVHFLSKYLRARREQRTDAATSVRYAFHSVGYALITTSIVLAAGFLILALSAFKLNADMGLLTAIVIGLALLADFLFLPTLLMLFEGNKDENPS